MKAKAFMTVKPDLDEALKHANLAHQMIFELTSVIESAHREGVCQPPDVIRRINRSHSDIHELLGEIVTCQFIIDAGDRRTTSSREGRRAPNLSQI